MYFIMCVHLWMSSTIEHTCMQQKLHLKLIHRKKIDGNCASNFNFILSYFIFIYYRLLH